MTLSTAHEHRHAPPAWFDDEIDDDIDDDFDDDFDDNEDEDAEDDGDDDEEEPETWQVHRSDFSRKPSGLRLTSLR